MNSQSFSDSNKNLSQSQNLSQTVEDLEVKLERLQGLAQTLIGGLVVAIIITISVSGWFAYRLILQEQTARRKAQEFEENKIELQEQLANLEQRVTSQQQQIDQLRNKLSQDLETLRRAIESNQEGVESLQEEINELDIDQTPPPQNTSNSQTRNNTN